MSNEAAEEVAALDELVVAIRDLRADLRVDVQRSISPLMSELSLVATAIDRQTSVLSAAADQQLAEVVTSLS